MKIHLNHIQTETSEVILINLFENFGDAVIKKVQVDYATLKNLSDKIYTKLNLLLKKKRLNADSQTSDADIKEELMHIGKELYSLLFSQLHNVLQNTKDDNLILSIDEKLHYIPFEVLFDGWQFLCLKFKFAKQIVSESINRESAQQENKTSPNTCVILSNPSLDKNLENILKSERDYLYNKFKKSQQISVKPPVIGKNVSIDYFNKLWNTKIVYYAGHSKSGNNESNLSLFNQYLTPKQIQKLDLKNTDLFYLNSCESAMPSMSNTSFNTSDENSESLFTAFLKAGVKNIIGNLTEVHNERASTFAKKFFDELIAGKSIAEAIQTARIFSIKKYGWGELIWITTTYYGNPDWKIVKANNRKPILITLFTILAILLIISGVVWFPNSLKTEAAETLPVTEKEAEKKYFEEETAIPFETLKKSQEMKSLEKSLEEFKKEVEDNLLIEEEKATSNENGLQENVLQKGSLEESEETEKLIETETKEPNSFANEQQSDMFEEAKRRGTDIDSSLEEIKKDIKEIKETVKSDYGEVVPEEVEIKLTKAPKSPKDYYGNMLYYASVLHLEKSKEAFRGYLKYNLPYIEPHLYFQKAIKSIAGIKEAKQFYENLIAENDKPELDKIYRFAYTYLLDKDTRQTELRKLINDYPDYEKAKEEIFKLKY